MSGIKKRTSKQKHLLMIKLTGADVERSGAVPIPILIKICQAIQGAVENQLELEYSKSGVHASPEYTLELVRLGKGSTILEFELTRPQMLIGAEQDFGEKAVVSVVKMVKELGSKKPPQIEQSTIGALRQVARLSGPNLSVAFMVPKERTAKYEQVKATLNQIAVERIEFAATSQLTQRSAINKTMEGVVEMADFKPSDHKFRLVLLYGQPVVCSFSESIAQQVHDLTRSVVRVTGIAEIDANKKILSFQVSSISKRDSPIGSGFLEAKSIAQLIAEQNVKPLKSISQLHGIWPDNEPKPN